MSPILGGSFLSLSVALLGTTAPVGQANAATVPVANCNASGPGSLRTAVESASSGDVIDLRTVPCNRIVLSNYWLTTPVNNLTLVGPGRSKLTIDGDRRGPVIAHWGGGTLKIKGLSIANGFNEYVFVRGGCIYSLGNVELHGSSVHHCVAQGVDDRTYPIASGGGIYAAGTVSLMHSSVFSNAARSVGYGGGISASHITLHHSQVYDNIATQGGGLYIETSLGTVAASYSLIHNNRAWFAGGIDAPKVTLNKSTVSSNTVDWEVSPHPNFDGPVPWYGGVHTGDATIVDSTLSGNSAEFASAIGPGAIKIRNSTIAFNIDRGIAGHSVCHGVVQTNALDMVSSIIARSQCGLGQPVDLGNVSGPVNISRSLVETSLTPLPAGTISADPRLAPLGANGGPTRTHALLADSPAINMGANPFRRLYDQRGPGYPRRKGVAADIGAFEADCPVSSR